MFVNAWHAYDNQGLQPPFHRLEGWLALSEAERQGIIKRFSLDTVDHTPNLIGCWGKSANELHTPDMPLWSEAIPSLVLVELEVQRQVIPARREPPYVAPIFL